MVPAGRHAARLAALATVLVCAWPEVARACAVCYGETDSPMARGLVWGILVLLGVLLAVVAGVGWFFVHMRRREAAVSVAKSGAEASFRS